MILYEITNGATGESYVRAYCWAADESQARLLYAARHGDRGTIQLRAVLDEYDGPFVTDLSDSGWPSIEPL